jgi:transcriptional regulator with XRE-family HTH domain
MRPPRNIVGPVVRRIRDGKGLTQEALAAKLNCLGWDISRETLAKIESQIRWVADFELVKIAAALETTPQALLSDADLPTP